jgi:hypothetical protein
LQAVQAVLADMAVAAVLADTLLLLLLLSPGQALQLL